MTQKNWEMIERERLFDFLVGFDLGVWWSGRVLGKIPLPSISDVFAYLRGEEGCKSIMLRKPKNKLPMLDSSAFATSKTVGKKNIAKDKMCNYCNKPCHTTEMC